MKPIRVLDDIISVGDLKVHAARILRQVRESGHPVVITQHGRPAGVLVSPEEFDRMSEHAHFVLAVREGLADTAAGRVVDDTSLDAELDAVLRRGQEP